LTHPSWNSNANSNRNVWSSSSALTKDNIKDVARTGVTTRSQNIEEMFGTRFLGEFQVSDTLTGYMCHPSPRHADKFFKHTLKAICQENRGRNFFVVGDFNVAPTDRIPSLDTTVAKYVEELGCRVVAPNKATHDEGTIDWVVAGPGAAAPKTCLVLEQHSEFPGMYSDHKGIYFDV
jgi:hypothetical protein